RLCIGLLTVPAIILGAATLGGSIYDFWMSYILSSLAYILWDYMPYTFVMATPGFGPFFDGLAAVSTLGGLVLLIRWKHISPKARSAYVGGLVILAAGIYTIYAPKRGSISYLPFGVLPASVAAAAGLGLIAGQMGSPQRARLRRVFLYAAFIVVSLGTMSAFNRPENPRLASVSDYYYGPTDPVNALLAQYVRPGDRLATWGWRPQYFVDSYTLLGTRDSMTTYQRDFNLNPYLAYFRARYIKDFVRNQPVGLLDTGPDSFDFSGKGADGHEIFPDLTALLQRDYHLVGHVNFTRLYIRNSPAAGVHEPVSRSGA
ncbi:MAG TPA: hypothetical protein VGD50_07760, partial [Candidatus Baltobacteraceae bacterium]